MNNALLSSKDMSWMTPEEVLAPIRKFGSNDSLHGITLDPCTTPDNPCQALLFMSSGALTQDWQKHAAGGLIYANPPYGRELGNWTAKFRLEGQMRGAELITLTPARPDTNWWHRDMITASRILFWKGRIKFVGRDGPMDAAPFPCALSYWGKWTAEFDLVFKRYGWIVTP